jgi:DNA topoisomerase-1
MTEKLQEKKELGAKGKKKRGEKIDARRASIPVGVSPETVTVEDAVKYLSLPRALGEHPESQKTITASTGRFGPYIVHEGDFRSLKGADNPYEITLVRALEILKEPKKTRPGVSFVREIGEHPRTKRKIMLYKSKSGHFLKKGFKRIMISDEKAPSLSPEEAAEILKSA